MGEIIRDGVNICSGATDIWSGALMRGEVLVCRGGGNLAQFLS